jgi:hypothetical protein
VFYGLLKDLPDDNSINILTASKRLMMKKSGPSIIRMINE